MTPSSPSSRGPDADDGDGAPALASELGRYGGHGLTIAASTALFGWLGTLLDERLGTGPLFVLTGVFLGFGAAFYSMIRKLTAEGDGADGDRPPDDAGPGSDA